MLDYLKGCNLLKASLAMAILLTSVGIAQPQDLQELISTET